MFMLSGLVRLLEGVQSPLDSLKSRPLNQGEAEYIHTANCIVHTVLKLHESIFFQPDNYFNVRRRLFQRQQFWSEWET